MKPTPLTPKEKALKSAAIKAHRFCYVPVVVSDGCSLGVAIEGISGYAPTDFPSVPEWSKARDWANECNKALGLTPEQAGEIQLTTLRKN